MTTPTRRSSLTIGQPQSTTFSLENGYEHTQTVESINEFKKFAGFGGTVVDCDGNPVQGVKVKIVGPNGQQIPGSPALTNADGNYLVAYKHSGKEASYTLTVVDGSGNAVPGYSPVVQPVKSNKFAIVNFAPTSGCT
jgi:protocatechuate 3,4-dioxygenase beta subunit